MVTSFSELFFQSPRNVSTYQYEGWANDTLFVENMNTKLPDWFENNSMNKWEDKSRQPLVTKDYLSNGSNSDVAPQTSEMSVRNVNTYPEAIKYHNEYGVN